MRLACKKYIVLNVNDKLSQVLLIALIFAMMLCSVMLYSVTHEVHNMRKELDTNIVLQQAAIELICQSAETQNAALEAMGVKIDGKM